MVSPCFSTPRCFRPTKIWIEQRQGFSPPARVQKNGCNGFCCVRDMFDCDWYTQHHSSGQSVRRARAENILFKGNLPSRPFSCLSALEGAYCSLGALSCLSVQAARPWLPIIWTGLASVPHLASTSTSAFQRLGFQVAHDGPWIVPKHLQARPDRSVPHDDHSRNPTSGSFCNPSSLYSKKAHWSPVQVKQRYLPPAYP